MQADDFPVKTDEIKVVPEEMVAEKHTLLTKLQNFEMKDEKIVNKMEDLKIKDEPVVAMPKKVAVGNT